MFHVKPYAPLVVLIALLWGSISSCRPDSEIITENPEQQLRFSTDTVIFDTLFSTVGSVTKRLKVYNPNDKAVEIEEIRLGTGKSSSYRLWVQGRQQESFAQEVLYGGDSLLLLVEVTIDPEDQDLPFLVKDSVVFDMAQQQQHVKLVAWGQDAHFFRSKGRFSELDCRSRWTADRPYVIYDSLYIPEACELVIEAGCQIYFNNKAGMYIAGKLQVEGTTENPVLIRNVRLDYEKARGQWQGLVFLPGSDDNHIRNASIRNADVGLWLNTFDEDNLPDLTLENVALEHMSSAAILAVNSDLYAANVLTNNCESFTALHMGGGNYTYEHCTFVGSSGFRENEAVVFTDKLENPEDDSLIVNPLYVRLANTIIWGNMEEELLVGNEGGMEVQLEMWHNLIRSKQKEWEINNNILTSEAEYPKFVDTYENDYRLDSLSPLIDKGLRLKIETDIAGTPRDEKPDIGAYEWTESKEEK
jgi:hypothetical protein